VIAASFGAGFGLSSYLAGSLTVESIAPIPPTADEQERIQDLRHRYEMLKTNLDVAAEEAKRIDRFMTLLLALTSLYAIALGLNSYFGLKQVLDTAKEDSKNAVERAERSAIAITAAPKENSDRMMQNTRAELDSV
jgi:hypothetical protein